MRLNIGGSPGFKHSYLGVIRGKHAGAGADLYSAANIVIVCQI